MSIQNMNTANKSKGFSLIELMVAMAIGLIILLGLVAIFSSSSALNRAQSGLATLQENGRYAMMRIKSDIEAAGRKHCATMALPNEFVSKWEQGYLMNSWTVDNNVNFNNGWPVSSNVFLDTISSLDTDQLGDTVASGTTLPFYPLDPSYFIMGHECDGTTCTPALNTVGADTSAAVPNTGTTNGMRAPNTDVLTVRYLQDGTPVTGTGAAANVLQLGEDPAVTNTADIAIVGDCETTFVANATWAGTSVTLNSAAAPEFVLASDTKAYSYSDDLRTVTYFVEFNTDLSNPGRQISSLVRSQNGQNQVIVEGVERMDVFYLAQMQTGEVARLTAAEVQNISDGGDQDSDGAIDNNLGCINQPRVNVGISSQGFGLANDNGCLWRSIYAIEVHLLLNTVNNSSTVDNDEFIYGPDGDVPQIPTDGLASGVDAERMYRKEFSAIVPVRSYTL